MAGDRFAVWRGGNDADQPAMLLEALEVVVTQANHLAPGHEASKADRRTLEPDPDVGAPAFWFGNIDQDGLVRQIVSEDGFHTAGHPQFHLAAARGVVEKRSEA